MLKTRLWMILALLTMSAVATATSPADRWLDVAQVRTDVALAEEAYSRIHPGYTRYADAETMASAWRSIVSAAERNDGMTVADLYIGVERALVEIRCDHTKAELPRPLADERRSVPMYLPFRWQLVDDRGFITLADSATELSRGTEILAIDDRPLAELVAEVAPLIPVDGYTEWAKRGEISASLEFLGGALDHFGALLWEIAPTATLQVRDPGGQEHTVTVQRLTFDGWTALDKASGRAANFKDAVTFERIGERAGYLRVDTFVNYRQPVDPDSLYSPIFAAIKTEQRDTLILDLRNNGGGSSDANHRLMAHLIDKKMRAVNDMRAATLDFDNLREHLWTWDKRALNPNRLGFRKNDDGTYSLRKIMTDDMDVIKPAKHAFTGKLIVLTSTNNSSGSTNLISILKSLGRATFIGEKTGGSAEGPTAGILFTLTLPASGIKTRVPFFRHTNNVETFEHGLGVSPDVFVPMTIDAFLAGKDPALETAIEMAR